MRYKTLKFLDRRNNYTKIVFANIYCSKPVDIVFLKSQQQFKNIALESIMSICRVFETHSTVFIFEFLDIVSVNRDFKFMYLKTEKKYYVEAKSRQYRLHIDVEYSSSTIRYAATRQSSQDNRSRSIFNLEVQWNFLYTILNYNDTSNQQALFLSRNIISAE